MSHCPEWRQEGKVSFRVNKAFYRPQSQAGRDLAILAATVYRRDRGQLRVLDAMTGCGVRALRYQVEARADWVWANEGNPDLHQLLEDNLSIGMQPGAYRLTHQDANQIFFTCFQQQDYYDLVDVDNFGGPAPYAANALLAVTIGGLLYLTSTDGRATGGRQPKRSLTTYGAYARSHPAVHEQGLRLLIGYGAQQAAARGLRATPVFSFFNGQVHRVMMRLEKGSNWRTDHYGFIAYCHRCGHFQTVSWKQLGCVCCPCSAVEAAPAVSGPMWLGPLHAPETLNQMNEIAQEWGWQNRSKLLGTMRLEAAMPPYFYSLGNIGRLGQMDIPPRERLIKALQERGFEATPTHVDWQAIKTTATLAECIEVARKC